MNHYFYCDHGGRESRRTTAINCINLCCWKQDYQQCSCFNRNVTDDDRELAESAIKNRGTFLTKQLILEARKRVTRQKAEDAEKRREIMEWHPFKDCYSQTQLYAWKLRLLNGESTDLTGLKCFTGDWREGWREQKLDYQTIIDSILQTPKPPLWDLMMRERKENGIRLDTRDIRTRSRDNGLVWDGKERRPGLPDFATGITGLQVEKQIPRFSFALSS